MYIDWITEAVSSLPVLSTAKETADTLRMSQRQLRRLIVAERIPAIRGREGGSSRVLVPRASIEKYLRSLSVSP